MKKLAFKIYLNHELITTSGIDTEGSLTQTLNLKNDFENEKQSIILHNGAYLSDSKDHYKWIDRELKENDKLTVEIVEVAKFDAPTNIYPDDPGMNALVLSSKLKTYYRLKEELKEHLKE